MSEIHTPEPWETGQYEWSIDALDGTVEVAQAMAACPQWQANRNRIIVCVNACRGIPDTALIRLDVQDAIATLGIQVGELVAALRRLLHETDGGTQLCAREIAEQAAALVARHTPK